MTATSLSPLDRLRHAPSDADWRRLTDPYRQLIRPRPARVPGLRDEADDRTQEVLLVVVREIVRFERQREGSFRAWLRRVTVNGVRERRRKKARTPWAGLDHATAEGYLSELEDAAGELASPWDQDHDRHVFERLIEAVRGHFQADTWRTFARFALGGRPAKQVAPEVGLTENAVILAKARVLSRPRQEAGVLLD